MEWPILNMVELAQLFSYGIPVFDHVCSETAAAVLLYYGSLCGISSLALSMIEAVERGRGAGLLMSVMRGNKASNSIAQFCQGLIRCCEQGVQHQVFSKDSLRLLPKVKYTAIQR